VELCLHQVSLPKTERLRTPAISKWHNVSRIVPWTRCNWFLPS
jgi:hypothetical protein